MEIAWPLVLFIILVVVRNRKGYGATRIPNSKYFVVYVFNKINVVITFYKHLWSDVVLNGVSEKICSNYECNSLAGFLGQVNKILHCVDRALHVHQTNHHFALWGTGK